MSLVRVVVFTLVALSLALVLVAGFGQLGIGGFAVLLALAVLGFAVWWRRGRTNS
jgi:hypothetical protein